ncbi:hypothetical protein [Bradyrhizobium sp. Gha]|uniref:hypothetical protein n=1 Tax=Bradyrhizobium sp. Gha TaxID=1855318 RepID=UPI0008EEE0F6|nr:hypothetical protein [Bradyrhizobium sp. Gha]SFI39872.1 hypothetical protein SAMN05216525_10868 [Bradyrhizobium sp. Gha]
MTNVIPFGRKNHMTATPAEDQEANRALEPRAPFSFDMIQPGGGDLVLIDACVPMALAVRFAELMAEFQEDSAGNSNKRRSRKKVAASA